MRSLCPKVVGLVGSAVAALLLAAPISASAVRGYDDSFVDALPAVLQQIDPTNGNASVPGEYAGCAFSPPNTVFSVAFTSGLDVIGGTLYGLEWDGGSGPDIFLYTVASSGCATGTRIGTGLTPVGFTNLESLAYNADDGFLYSVDFDFGAHTGSLIGIDPATGIGLAIGGPMASDLRVVGLAWDPLTGVLLGVTSAFGAGVSALVTIDTDTGAATVVGPTGLAAGAIESLAIDLAGGPTQLIGAGSTLFSINRTTGAASAIGDTFNGTVWAMTESHAVIFADGFETGDRSRWSTSLP